jgi:hypothetical protein
MEALLNTLAAKLVLGIVAPQIAVTLAALALLVDTPHSARVGER